MTRVRRATAPPLAAYVLHRWDWSESSLIVDLFTRELGRVVVVAKGAKRPYSQLRPVLLPFQRLAVTLGRTAGDEAAEIHPLRSAEWGGGLPLTRGDALLSGFYLNELLLRLLARQDPHPRLFDAYADTLPELDRADDARTPAALRSFELVLLREVGLLPELAVVTSTQRAVEADAPYALHAEAGVVGAAPGEPALRGRTLQALHAALGQGGLGALQAACAEHRAELRGPLRQLLHYHLGSPHLRTRDVVRDLQRLAHRTDR